MVHPRLALNSLSTASWPLERDLELYGALGVARAGLFSDKLLAVGAERAVQLVRAAGIEVTEVTCRGPTPADPGGWADDRRRIAQALELAVELGSPFVSVTTGSAGHLDWESAADALGAALAPVVEEASARGVTVAIEQTLPIRPEVGFVHSFADTVELARRFGLKAILEAHYCFAERGIGESIAEAAPLVAVVQLSDLVPPLSAVLDRAVPGDGVIPLPRLVATLLRSGYQGVFEIEMLGPRVEDEGYVAACRRAVAVLDSLLVEAGA